MKVIQLVPSLKNGDAPGNEILAVDKFLKEHGYDAEIRAAGPDSGMMPCADSADMPCADSDAKPCVLYYHGITPPAFLHPYDEKAAEAHFEARKALRSLYASFDYALCDSEYLADELRAFGYTCPIEVVPVLLPPEEYRQEPDPELLSRLKDGKKNILSAGAFTPEKKWEDVIESFLLYKKHWNPEARLILAGKYTETDAYFRKLQALIGQADMGAAGETGTGASREAGSGDILLTGDIGARELSTYYAAADLYLCLSEYEGFCRPVAEAMALKKPVLAYDSSAVPETLGETGMVIHEKNPLQTAGLMNYVLTHPDFRGDLVRKQNGRVKDFEYGRCSKQLLQVLEKIRTLRESAS